MVRTKTFKIRSVFPPGDDDSVTVLRVLAVANDILTMIRLMPASRGADESDSWKRSLANSERHYLMRMTALHIGEIKELVNHPDFSRVVERCARVLPEGQLLSDQAAELRRRLNSGSLREVIGHIRNGFGAHYDRHAFGNALRKTTDGELMDVPFGEIDPLEVHFPVADALFDVAFIGKSHDQYHGEDVDASVEEAVLELSNATGPLHIVARGLLKAFCDEALVR